MKATSDYKGFAKTAAQAKSLEKELRWQLKIIVLYTTSQERKWYRQKNLLFELFASIRRIWGDRAMSLRDAWTDIAK